MTPVFIADDPFVPRLDGAPRAVAVTPVDDFAVDSVCVGNEER